jgi:hypothetical protein
MTPSHRRFPAALALLALTALASATPALSGRVPNYLSRMLSGIVHVLPEHSGSHECDLCADNWMFVLAAGGRTGSTTAMSMFNSVPGFEIGGEHLGVLDEEMNFMAKIQQVDGNPDWTNKVAWQHRPRDLHALRCATQEKMKRLVFGADYDQLNREVRVLGFKEIRYYTLPKMAFIASVFPCARFVFTYRSDTAAEVNAVDGFGKWLQGLWGEASLLYTRLAQEFPSQMDMLAVESLSPERYSEVLHELLGVRGCSFSQIVHENPDGGYSTPGTDPTKDVELMDGSCDLDGVDFRLTPQERQHNAEKWKALMVEFKAHERAADEEKKAKSGGGSLGGR